VFGRDITPHRKRIVSGGKRRSIKLGGVIRRSKTDFRGLEKTHTRRLLGKKEGGEKKKKIKQKTGEKNKNNGLIRGSPTNSSHSRNAVSESRKGKKITHKGLPSHATEAGLDALLWGGGIPGRDSGLRSETVTRGGREFSVMGRGTRLQVKAKGDVDTGPRTRGNVKRV